MKLEEYFKKQNCEKEKEFLISKIKELENNINEINEKLERKKRIISNKKKENLILAEMLSDKKDEISSLAEIVKVIDSSSFKSTFENFEQKEKNKIKLIQELTNSPDYTDNSDESEAEDEESQEPKSITAEY